MLWLEEKFDAVGLVCCPAQGHNGDYAGKCLGSPTIQLTDDHGVDLTFNCDYHGDFVVSVSPIPDTSGNVAMSVRWGAGNSRQRAARRPQTFGPS